MFPSAREYAVVVLLPEHIILHNGLERAEGITPGELVERIVVKRCGKLAAEHGGERDLGRLRKPAPLGDGKHFVRADQVQEKTACCNEDKTCAEDAVFQLVIHACSLLKNGNTGMG